ncbi:hypothetical protein [Rickettsia endosymbiont of Urophora cardui]|uniref:hypothetical protein n=1 Tax=Rickettsia endosymbiont of Urophora cardui TaxID=3066265 RepID=UPI00313D85E6
MFKSTSLFKAGVLNQLLNYYNALLPFKNDSIFKKELESFYFQIVLILPYVEDEIMLRNILDNIELQVDLLYDPALYNDSWVNTLLCEAIHLENQVLVRVLISYDSRYNTRSDLLDFIRKHPALEQLIVNDLRILKVGTIIAQQFIRLEEFNNHQALALKINSIVQLSLVHNQDFNVLKQEFGFNNNIFHAIALDNTISVQDCFKIFKHFGQRIEYLLEYNALGHRPLYNAVFICNKNFLTFYSSVTKINNVDIDDKWIVDKYANNVAHILARIQYDDNVKYVLTLCNAVYEVLPYKNHYQQSAICDAIIFRNIPFINYWEQNNFGFTELDKGGNSLWQYYVISGYESQEPYILEQSLELIYEKLKSKIAQTIYKKNHMGLTPIQLAIKTLRVTALELLLNSHTLKDRITFTDKDNEGYSISDIMAMNFGKNYHNNVRIAAIRNIVNLLIPFVNSIKSNYHDGSQRILDILTQKLQKPLWLFLNDLFRTEVLNILRKNGHTTISDQHNDFFIRANDVIQAAISRIKLQDLSQKFKDTINALQFDIVFCKTNVWGDNLINVLMTKEHIGFTQEYMIPLIIELLSPELKQHYMHMSNNIGQLPVHIAAESPNDIIDYFLLSALSHQLCKFREPLNSTIKFDHKMSHSFIPIGDRHRPFFGNIINCQI